MMDAYYWTTASCSAGWRVQFQDRNACVMSQRHVEYFELIRV
jgi:hypothetical protein